MIQPFICGKEDEGALRAECDFYLAVIPPKFSRPGLRQAFYVSMLNARWATGAQMEKDLQRRSHSRAECHIEASVVLSDGLTIACRIKDLSSTGFKIQVVEPIHLPPEFDLLMPVRG